MKNIEEWERTNLQRLAVFTNGRFSPERREGATYPVYGSNGVIGSTDSFNTQNQSIVIGRVGSYCGSLYFTNSNCWVTDNAIIGTAKKDTNARYLFYLLKTLNLNARAGGSGQPLINQFILNSIEVSRPPLPEQRSIANILSSLDDKIELLRKQNETLEKIAQVIFNEWFSGNKGSNIRLGDFVTIKRGGSPRPIQDFISPTGLRWLKISDATATTSPYILEIKECIKVEGLSKTIFVKTGSLVLSNSATPGVPKILAVDSCIHDGWLYFQKSKFSNEFLYLFFKHIRSQLVQQGSGSVFTNLKTDILKDFELKIPDDKKLIEFDNVAKPIFAKILNNTTQMQTLSRLGNTLLPKLIAGEIRVN